MTIFILPEIFNVQVNVSEKNRIIIYSLANLYAKAKKIAANLGLPEICDTTYISDVATQEEMETARRIRVTEGKHVIPVPTFEIKKDFSGYLLDPLQIFKTKGRGKEPYISEKSIIRPTFSYMGNFTISDTVFRQIIEYLASKTIEIHKVQKIRVDNFGEGVKLYMEVTVVYGFNVVDGINEFKAKAKKEIDQYEKDANEKLNSAKDTLDKSKAELDDAYEWLVNQNKKMKPVHVGDDVIDGTVKSKLDEMKEIMLKK